jgi:hypothetical protein
MGDKGFSEKLAGLAQPDVGVVQAFTGGINPYVRLGVVGMAIALFSPSSSSDPLLTELSRVSTVELILKILPSKLLTSSTVSSTVSSYEKASSSGSPRRYCSANFSKPFQLSNGCGIVDSSSPDTDVPDSEKIVSSMPPPCATPGLRGKLNCGMVVKGKKRKGCG